MSDFALISAAARPRRHALGRLHQAAGPAPVTCIMKFAAFASTW